MAVEYDCFLGVYGDSNPGRHAVAMVVVCGERRYEWARAIADTVTTPRAWLIGVDHAVGTVKRPGAVVTIAIRDKHAADVCTADSEPCGPHADLLERIIGALKIAPDTQVAWFPKRNMHPEMERAHELARAAFAREIAA
jgi:ribonuclease HI